MARADRTDSQETILTAVVKMLLREYDGWQLFYERHIARVLSLEPAQVHASLLQLEALEVVERESAKQKGGWRVRCCDLATQAELLDIRRSLVITAAEKLTHLMHDTEPFRRAAVLAPLETAYRSMVACCDALDRVHHPNRHAMIIPEMRRVSTQSFISAHNSFLLQIAGAATYSGTQSMLHHVCVRLDFCHLIYPQHLWDIVGDEPEADSLQACEEGTPKPLGCREILEAFQNGDGARAVALLTEHLNYFEQSHQRFAEIVERLRRNGDRSACEDTTDMEALVAECWPMVVRVLKENKRFRAALPSDLNMDQLRSEVIGYVRGCIYSLEPGERIDKVLSLPLLVVKAALICGHLQLPESQRTIGSTAVVFRSLILLPSRTRLSRAEYKALFYIRMGCDTKKISGYLKTDPANVRFTLHRARLHLLRDLPRPLLYLLLRDTKTAEFFAAGVDQARRWTVWRLLPREYREAETYSAEADTPYNNFLESPHDTDYEKVGEGVRLRRSSPGLQTS